MTEWEQRELFGRLDRIAELLEKIDGNTNVKIGVDMGLIENDFTIVGDKIVPKMEFTVEVEPQDEESIDTSVDNSVSSRKMKVNMDRDEYRIYKENGGTMKWNEWHSRKRGKTKVS